MKNPKRKMISVEEETISPYDFDTNLKTLKEKIDGLITQYGEDATIDWDPNFYHAYETQPSPRFTLNTHRPENDEEYNSRIKASQQQTKLQEQKELEEFQRLSKKFSNK